MTDITVELTVDLPYEIDETDQHDCEAIIRWDGDVEFTILQFIFAHGVVDNASDPALFEFLSRQVYARADYQDTCWEELGEDAPRERGYEERAY